MPQPQSTGLIRAATATKNDLSAWRKNLPAIGFSAKLPDLCKSRKTAFTDGLWISNEGEALMRFLKI